MSSSNDSKLPFAGKVIWITGASSGIGEALSYRLSALGANLILSARRKDRLDEVNNQLPRNPGSAKVLPFDLEKLDELPERVNDALSYHHRIDCLVNNAGLAVKDFALNTELSIDRKIMDVNYFAPIVLSKCLLPHFLERKEGQIVVTSSLSGKFGVPRISSYTASKHALHGFFETLRSEIAGNNIYITMIVLGIIRTEITAHALTGNGTSYGKIESSFKTGYPVEKTAIKMAHAILKKKEEDYIGGAEGITLLLNKFSPWLLRRVVRNHPLKRVRQLKRKLGIKNKVSDH